MLNLLLMKSIRRRLRNSNFQRLLLAKYDAYGCNQDLGSSISVMPFCLGVGTGLVSDLVLLTREMGFPMPAKLLFPQGPILRGGAMGACSCCIFVANTDSKEELLAGVCSGFLQFSLPSCSVFTCAFALYGDLSEGGGGALLFFPLLPLGLISLFESRCTFF